MDQYQDKDGRDPQDKQDQRDPWDRRDLDGLRPRRRFRMGFLVKAICAVLCVGVLGGAVMLLWNCVIPPIFPGAVEIGFWRALGLLVLCRILFGGFRGRPGGWHEKKRRMRARWQAMTPEERERFQSRWRMFGCSGRDRERE